MLYEVITRKGAVIVGIRGEIEGYEDLGCSVAIEAGGKDWMGDEFKGGTLGDFFGFMKSTRGIEFDVV